MRMPIAPTGGPADRERRASSPATLAWFRSSSSRGRIGRAFIACRHGTQHPEVSAANDGSGLRDRRLIGRRGRRGNGRRRLRHRLRGGIRLWCGLRYRLWHRWLGDFRSVIHVSSSSREDSSRTHRSRASGGEDTTILPRASAGVRHVLLRRFVHPAPLGSVVDREHGVAALVAACSIVRIRPSGTASAAGRDAADRESLIVSLCHRRAPPFLDRSEGVELPGARVAQTSHDAFRRGSRRPCLGAAGCRTTPAWIRPR